MGTSCSSDTMPPGNEKIPDLDMEQNQSKKPQDLNQILAQLKGVPEKNRPPKFKQEYYQTIRNLRRNTKIGEGRGEDKKRDPNKLEQLAREAIFSGQVDVYIVRQHIDKYTTHWLLLVCGPEGAQMFHLRRERPEFKKATCVAIPEIDWAQTINKYISVHKLPPSGLTFARLIDRIRMTMSYLNKYVPDYCVLMHNCQTVVMFLIWDSMGMLLPYGLEDTMSTQTHTVAGLVCAWDSLMH